MDKKEAIAHLEELKNDFNEYVSIETNIKDVQALEVALEVLKKIDNKVATQENSKQITILIDGKEVAKKMPVQEQFKQVGLTEQILVELQKIRRIMERQEEYVDILKCKHLMNIKNDIKLNAKSGENIDVRDIEITFQEALKVSRQFLQEGIVIF